MKSRFCDLQIEKVVEQSATPADGSRATLTAVRREGGIRQRGDRGVGNKPEMTTLSVSERNRPVHRRQRGSINR